LKSKKWLYIALIIIALGLIIRIILTLFCEPWIAKKLEVTLNEKNLNYLVRINKVHISVISSGIELDTISITSGGNQNHGINIKGTISSVKIKGFNIVKAILNKKIAIRSITIANSRIEGILPEKKESVSVVVLPIDIKIERIIFDKTNVSLSNNRNSLFYSLNEGVIKVYGIHFFKQDTLSIRKIKKFDFKATKFSYTGADSMNSYASLGIDYSSKFNLLKADSVSIHPDFTDYDFTSRYEFQKDRIEAGINKVSLHNFNAPEYLSSGMLYCSYSEIGNLEMNVFRDKRKEFRHINKPTFQDMIYSYPGYLRLDSISILSGNITYKEHAEKAHDQGYIEFSKINAMILNITNDTIYRTNKAFFELRCNALLMGKGKITILLKSKIFESQNTFSVKGTLSDMEISEMNPYLGNSAFVYATSGKIDKIDFSFTANNTESKGSMTMIYNGLDLAFKNKNTDDTTAFKERLISVIANIKVIDSNPLPGNELRIGAINCERDPERYLFNYCARSILSGIKSSLLKNPK